MASPEKRDPENRRIAKEVIERLDQLMTALKIKKIDFERKLDIGQSSVSQWFLRYNLPSTIYFVQLPRAIFELTGTKINLHWLATGEGEPTYRAEERESQTDAHNRGVMATVLEIHSALANIQRRTLKRDLASPDDDLEAIELTVKASRAKERKPAKKRRRNGGGREGR